MELDAIRAHAARHKLRVKLIFNPISGAASSSPGQLMDILTEMQSWNIVPEVFLIQPGIDLPAVVRDSLRRGIRMFVVSGGDGTIDTVAGTLTGTWATLGIIPTGTRNNVAASLGIPLTIPEAVALLRTGKRIKVDTGTVRCQETRQPFLEACSVGLLSALFPAADDIQHGNLARIPDLLAALVSSPPAQMRLVLEKQQEISIEGHVVVVGNMPYMGPHFRISPDSSCEDGLLDVLVIATASKLDLLGNVVQMVGGGPEDPRIQRYRTRSISIETNPAMPVIVDGYSLGEGRLEIHVRRRSLSVVAGEQSGGGEEDIAAI